MIITFFLNILNSFLVGLISLLPSGHLPTIMTTAFGYFMSLLNSFSFIIPVDTLLQAVGVVLLFDGVILLWNFINWIIRKVPGMQ